MTFRGRRLALVALVSLSLCGCAAAGGTAEASPSASGMLEMAVSEACADGSEPDCIAAGSGHVERPASFEPAGVEDAVVSGAQPNTVEVTFTSDGAAVLSDLSGRAAEAGADSRLVLKVGDEILAAVVVMEALSGDQVTISLSPDDDPQEMADLLRGP